MLEKIDGLTIVIVLVLTSYIFIVYLHMIDSIKNIIGLHTSLSSQKGIFLSCFDLQGSLLAAPGVISSDKDLNTVIDMLYHGLIESHIKLIDHIICDIVTSINLEQSMTSLGKIDMSHYGICVSTIDYSKTGVVLPATMGINTVTDALSYIKKKNDITGNISIYSFQTERFTIPLGKTL